MLTERLLYAPSLQALEGRGPPPLLREPAVQGGGLPSAGASWLWDRGHNPGVRREHKQGNLEPGRVQGQRDREREAGRGECPRGPRGGRGPGRAARLPGLTIQPFHGGCEVRSHAALRCHGVRTEPEGGQRLGSGQETEEAGAGDPLAVGGEAGAGHRGVESMPGVGAQRVPQRRPWGLRASEAPQG